MRCNRWLPTFLAVVLLLAGCMTPTVPARLTGEPGPMALNVRPTERTRIVRLAANSQVPGKRGFGTKAFSFSDPSVAYLRFTAAGRDFAPITVDYPWTPGTALPPLQVSVPIGSNRIFTLSALEGHKMVLSSLKGVATVQATGANAVTINWATTPTADVMEQLTISSPGVVDQVDVGQLQALVNTLTGYDAGTGTFTQNPGGVDTSLIANDIITNGGLVPASDPRYFVLVTGTVTVSVQTNTGTPVASGVRLQINDLTSPPIATTTANPTTITDVASGYWLVTASHPDFGVGTCQIGLGACWGWNRSVTVTLTNQAIQPPTDSGSVQSLFRRQIKALDGPLGTGTFGKPSGVAVVGNKAYVAEWKAVREVDLATGAITTLVGANDGVPGIVGGEINGGTGIAADPNGQYLYVTEQETHTVKRIDTASRTVSILAGSGVRGHVNATGTSAAFNLPCGIAVEPNGQYLLVADLRNSAIRKITLPGGQVTDLVGNGIFADTVAGGPGVGQVSWPAPIAIDPLGHYAYVTDSCHLQVVRVTLDPGVGPVGTLTVLTGVNTQWAFADGPPNVATFRFDEMYGGEAGRHVGLLVSPDNQSLFVSDTKNHRVRKVDLATNNTSTFVGSGRGSLADGVGTNASLSRPGGLALDGQGNLLFVDATNRRLRRTSLATAQTTTVAGSGPMAFAEGLMGSGGAYGDLHGLVFDPHRNRLYCQDLTGNRIVSFDVQTGAISNLAGDGSRGNADGPASSSSFDFPIQGTGLAYDAVRDCLYVTALGAVRKITLSGSPQVTTLASGFASIPVAIDDTATFLYTGDQRCARKIDLATGAVVATYSDPSLPSFFGGLAVVGTTLYVAPRWYDGYVKTIDTQSGTIGTFAGTGTMGYQDGAANVAQIGDTLGLTKDKTGTYLYLAESWDYHPEGALRRISLQNGTFDSLMRAPFDEVDGPFGTARVIGSRGIAFDSSGSALWFLESYGDSIRKVVFQHPGS